RLRAGAGAGKYSSVCRGSDRDRLAAAWRLTGARLRNGEEGLAVPARARAPRPNATQRSRGHALGARLLQRDSFGAAGRWGWGMGRPLRNALATQVKRRQLDAVVFFFCSSRGRDSGQDQRVNKKALLRLWQHSPERVRFSTADMLSKAEDSDPGLLLPHYC